MTEIKANPYVYIFPVFIFGFFALYYLYNAVDRLGLETNTANATVISKKYTEGSTNYVNTVAGGRTWVQSQKQPGFYTISLVVKKERAVAIVPKKQFDIIKNNDQVKVKIQRTRISGRLEIIDLKINN